MLCRMESETEYEVGRRVFRRLEDQEKQFSRKYSRRLNENL